MAAPPATRRRFLLLGSLGLLLLLGVLLFVFRGVLTPGPQADLPAVDLTGVDPAIRTAVEKAQNQVRQSPRSAAAWGRLGMVLTSHVFGEQALACFVQAERLEPRNPRWPYHQGLIQLASDPPASLPQIRRAVELNGDRADGPRLRLAELYLRLGEDEKAREQFRILLERDPRHARARLGMARLHFQAGDLDECRVHLADALDHPLTRKSALALSAAVHQRAGDARAAKQDLAQALDLPDDLEWPDDFVAEAARFKVGEAVRLQAAGRLLDQEHGAEAVALLQALVRDYPQSARGWALLGWAELKRNRLAEAEAALQNALSLNPRGAESRVHLGVVRHQAKDRRAAVALFRQALADKPDCLPAHFNLGLTLEEEGDHTAAITAFEDALRCQPLHAAAHAHLGELLLRQKRTAEAVTHLQQALDLRPDDANARRLLEEAQTKRD
jgi:tetratricopeptide (TPR) repeat protein